MASDDFLKIIKRTYGDVYAGDEFGGARGAAGHGLPTDSAGNFMFATGIECSNPQTKDGRRDLMEECGHYKMWERDFELVRELGLRVLRYGLPYHRVNYARGKYDWSFADLAMNRLKELGITPILDLLHFGVPDWIGDFQNPELPVLFAEYVGKVAERYPWVRYYTPVNEIYVSARVSGRDGLWNERLKSEKGFVTALKHLTASSILAAHEIARRRPDCIIVQSESAEFIHQVATEPDEEVELINRLRFLSLDLLYARQPDADIMLYMLDNGLTRDEYNWFMAGEPPGYQVMGSDYYGRNEQLKLPDGRMMQADDVLGWFLITYDYYKRYQKPVMHTETNTLVAESNPQWLWKQWCNIMRMRECGVPVVGFTWYSLTDQIDWDIELAEKRGTVNPCGLYDLNRNPRPVAEEYKKLLREFGQMKIVPHGEMFSVTSEPATMRVDL